MRALASGTARERPPLARRHAIDHPGSKARTTSTKMLLVCIRLGSCWAPQEVELQYCADPSAKLCKCICLQELSRKVT